MPLPRHFLHKPGQGAHQSDPQYLLSKLHDMLTSSLKIEEVIAFQSELIITEIWKLAVLEICVCLALFGPPKQILPELNNLCRFLCLQIRLQGTTFVWGPKTDSVSNLF